jgi:hypothetical protein
MLVHVTFSDWDNSVLDAPWPYRASLCHGLNPSLVAPFLGGGDAQGSSSIQQFAEGMLAWSLYFAARALAEADDSELGELATRFEAHLQALQRAAVRLTYRGGGKVPWQAVRARSRRLHCTAHMRSWEALLRKR